MWIKFGNLIAALDGFVYSRQRRMEGLERFKKKRRLRAIPESSSLEGVYPFLYFKFYLLYLYFTIYHKHKCVVITEYFFFKFYKFKI